MTPWFKKMSRLHRRQPLLIFTVLLFVGIIAGYRWGYALAAGVTVAALLLAVALQFVALYSSGFCLRFKIWTPLAHALVDSGHLPAMLLVLVSGWFIAAGDSGARAREERAFTAAGKSITAVCRVGSEVVVTPLKGKAHKYVFQADAFHLAKGRFALRHLPVTVTWFGGLDTGPQPGELWRLRGSGKVGRRRNGTLYLTFQSGEGRSERLAGADISSWRVRAELARRAVAKRVTKGIEGWGDIPALNQAMLLGSRHEMPRTMRRIFVNSGTIHVFAISGLHIVLVATVLTLVVAAFGVPQIWWALCVGPPLIFYTILTGARPSAVRACLMALLYMLAPLLGRRPNGIAALAGTAVILHIYRPWLIFDIGSVLSFTVMGGLVVFCEPFCRVAQRVCCITQLKEYARMLRMAGSIGRARKVEWLAKFIGYVANSFAVSLAAFLASLPLTACYFGRFTPGGLLANLVIGPCAFMIVVAGCLGVASSYVSSWLAICFNNAAGFFTWIMIKTAQFTVALPCTNFHIVKWSTATVWLWFALLTVFGLWLRLRTPRADGLAWLDDT